MQKLFPKVRQISQTAKQKGALVPIETVAEIVCDPEYGCEYLIKTALPGKFKKTSSLPENSNNTKTTTTPAAPKNRVFDVFKPNDVNLYVTDINNSHYVVLNKFQVADNHLLLLSKDFEPQTTHLHEHDMSASIHLIEQLEENGNIDEWLVFYNRGLLSGASQPHKHVQLLPTNKEMASLVPPLLSKLNHYASQNLTSVPEYHFKHAFCSLDEIHKTAIQEKDQQKRIEYLTKQVFAKYIELLKSLDLYDNRTLESHEIEEYLEVICEHPEEYHEKVSKQIPVDSHKVSLSTKKYPSYNLLFTTRWMVIVPRCLESYEDISLNSLGFAFSFFAKTEQDKSRLLKEIGVMNLLKRVTFPN